MDLTCRTCSRPGTFRCDTCGDVYCTLHRVPAMEQIIDGTTEFVGADLCVGCVDAAATAVEMQAHLNFSFAEEQKAREVAEADDESRLRARLQRASSQLRELGMPGALRGVAITVQRRRFRSDIVTERDDPTVRYYPVGTYRWRRPEPAQESGYSDSRYPAPTTSWGEGQEATVIYESGFLGLTSHVPHGGRQSTQWNGSRETRFVDTKRLGELVAVVEDLARRAGGQL